MDEVNQAEIDLESEPLVIGGFDFGTSDYHEAYRDGNFGVKRGRINFHRAKKWGIAHLMLAVLIVILSITVICLIESNHRYWIHSSTTDAFIGLSITCGIIAIATSCCSLYLLHYIATMSRPLFVLLLVRLLAVLECMLAFSTVITTIVAVFDSHKNNPYVEYVKYDRGGGYWHTDYPGQNINSHVFGLFVFQSILLLLALLVDIIAAMAWLIHWWRCCECCEQLKSWCIFEPGPPLADGVPDPRTGILRECMYVCWAAYKSDLHII